MAITAERIVPLESVISRPEGLDGDFSHDFADCVRRLQIALERRGWVGDEKVWVDRPILCGVRLKAAVDKLHAMTPDDGSGPLLAEEEAMAETFTILDECLGDADFGLYVVERSDTDFLPGQGSLLANAMRQVQGYADNMVAGYARQCGEDQGRLMRCSSSCYRQMEHWGILVQMTMEAFNVFRSLYRLQVVDGAIAVQMFHKGFTIDQLDQRIRHVVNQLPDVKQALLAHSLPSEKKGLASVDGEFIGDRFIDQTIPLFPFLGREYIGRGKSTLIEMPRPVVVPGGRFREGYYWDSYWIIRGLCAAGRYEEAIDLLVNFFSCIDRFGFVPNGLRTYYLDRSQPPLLSQSVFIVFQALTGVGRLDEAKDLLREAFPRLLQEYFGFWMDGRHGHVVAIQSDGTCLSQVPPNPFHLTLGPNATSGGPSKGKSGAVHLLNRYYSPCGLPRPESYTTDDLVLAGSQTLAANPPRLRAEIFQSIRAAAESGWDFSSRWDRDAVENGYSPTYSSIGFFDRIDTINIVPVDLNAFLYRFEKNMAFFATEMAKDGRTTAPAGLLRLADVFEKLAELRKEAMRELMWDDQERVWRDFDLCHARQSRVISAASIVPLWAGLSDDEDIPVDIHPSLFKGWGLVPTPCATGLQWDSPNVWPPLMHLAIVYLDSSRHDWTSWTSSHDMTSTTTTQSVPLGTDRQQSLSEEKGSKKRRSVIEAHVEIANQLAIGFVHAAVTFYSNSVEAGAEGVFSEKYNALYIGAGGSGGEYPNQTGFGWTNGALIDIIVRKWADLTA